MQAFSWCSCVPQSEVTAVLSVMQQHYIQDVPCLMPQLCTHHNMALEAAMEDGCMGVNYGGAVTPPVGTPFKGGRPEPPK